MDKRGWKAEDPALTFKLELGCVMMMQRWFQKRALRVCRMGPTFLCPWFSPLWVGSGLLV